MCNSQQEIGVNTHVSSLLVTAQDSYLQYYHTGAICHHADFASCRLGCWQFKTWLMYEMTTLDFCCLTCSSLMSCLEKSRAELGDSLVTRLTVWSKTQSVSGSSKNTAMYFMFLITCYVGKLTDNPKQLLGMQLPVQDLFWTWSLQQKQK